MKHSFIKNTFPRLKSVTWNGRIVFWGLCVAQLDVLANDAYRAERGRSVRRVA